MKIPYGVRLDQDIQVEDFDLLAKHVNFVWIRGGIGSKGVDSKYTTHVSWAIANRIPYGVYSEFKSTKNPKTQAIFHAGSFSPAPLGFGTMFADVVPGSKAETLNVFSKYIKFFREASGSDLTIITNASTWDFKPRTDWAKHLPLYSASWGRLIPRNPLDWSGINNPIQEFYWEFDSGRSVIGLVGSGTMLPQIQFSQGFDRFNKLFGVNSAPIIALPELLNTTPPPPPPPPPPGDDELKPGDGVILLTNLNVRDAAGVDRGRIIQGSIVPIEAVEGDRVKVSFYLANNPGYIKRTQEV